MNPHPTINVVPDMKKVKEALSRYGLGFTPPKPNDGNKPEDAHRRKTFRSRGDCCQGFDYKEFIHYTNEN